MRLKFSYRLLAIGLFLLGGCSPENSRMKPNDISLDKLSQHVASLYILKENSESSDEKAALDLRIRELEAKLADKRMAGSLPAVNDALLNEKLADHSRLGKMAGNYKVLVIPVQFADVKFDKPSFFTPDPQTGAIEAQNYLFGNHRDSMTEFYRHVSFGQFVLSGEVVPAVSVPGNLADYGEAVVGNHDKNARGLVVDALKQVKAMGYSDSWWESFDNWDPGDYDGDHIYREPDGFVDAIILIYAGKDQASCQFSFDPDNKDPASADVPPGPRHDPAVECFNRIWPHRSVVTLAPGDPLIAKEGPLVEGVRRPTFNSLKITDSLFVMDYNMQSEYSDRSTFIHEFGHSIGLPDVYAKKGENSTAAWELMSNNARLQPQELSTYSKLVLGWLSPKIVKEGERTGLYLGTYGFVSREQRETPELFSGPQKNEEWIDGNINSYDILSRVPSTGEPVYRSIVALTPPTEEDEKVAPLTPQQGRRVAYSGRFDGQSRSYKQKFVVSEHSDAQLSLDLYYHVETETNFNGNDPEVKVIADYDYGEILVNGERKDFLRLLSGDENMNGLNESSSACDEKRVLELRSARIAGTLTEEQKKELVEKYKACQTPSWITRKYDLSAYRGHEVMVEVRLTTDAGFNELGLLVDNIKVGGAIQDFESEPLSIGDKNSFMIIEDGIQRKFSNQFYLFEYRAPGERFGGTDDATELSYNFDNNIQMGTQAMFIKDGVDSTQRFRLITFAYQPGVLVWYFNSKYSRYENSPSEQGGKGYLLVLNAHPGELKLPGVFSQSWLFDDKGDYRTEDQDFQRFAAAQEQELVCFGYTAFATYRDGVTPNCSDFGSTDGMRSLTLGGKRLMYARELANTILPLEQTKYVGVRDPLITKLSLKNSLSIRTGLSTFRPEGEKPYAPFVVYKPEEGRMVPDSRLTETALKVNPVSIFRDRDNALLPLKRFAADSVLVEKKGFAFRIVAPSTRSLNEYKANVDSSSNDHELRRPRAKIYFDWES